MPSPSDERLTAWIDDELPPDEAAALAAELRADPAKAAEADRLRRTRDAVRLAPPLPAPDDLVDQVLDRLDAPPGRATAWTRQAVPWLLALAAAAVLWLALPARDDPSARPAAAPVDAGPVVVLVAPAWEVQTEAPADRIAAVVAAAGGRVARDADGAVIHVDAGGVDAVRRALGTIGAVRDDGDRRAAGGQVAIRLRVAPP